MFKLEPGKSYLWIFWAYLLLFSVFCFGYVGQRTWFIAGAAVVSTLLMASILICELLSGVALNATWRAVYRKGTWQYRATILWHTLGLMVFLVIAFVVIDWSVFTG